MLKAFLITALLAILVGCGHAEVAPATDYGEGVYALRFQQEFGSSGASRQTTMAEEATKFCAGPYEKVGEWQGPQVIDIVWYIRCLKKAP